jgi:hypothetical protein
MFLIPSKAENTITPPQIITGNQTLISPSQNFELGFFTPKNSTYTYLGIWYKQIHIKNIVWVANRDKPLLNHNGTLAFNNDGKLIILNHKGNVFWASNSSGPAKNPVAQLLDTGNFVLKNFEDENSDEILWQSFDYPSNTLLPGMKLV